MQAHVCEKGSRGVQTGDGNNNKDIEHEQLCLLLTGNCLMKETYPNRQWKLQVQQRSR